MVLNNEIETKAMFLTRLAIVNFQASQCGFTLWLKVLPMHSFTIYVPRNRIASDIQIILINFLALS